MSAVPASLEVVVVVVVVAVAVGVAVSAVLTVPAQAAREPARTSAAEAPAIQRRRGEESLFVRTSMKGHIPM
ncbi:hypothetical protein GCM10009808_20690 [Microbacterium sediminicola]|uniref:Uncharacterized protein n=1 Tax=Microbacterium sediminicola TaxID=415210 RepID=A0ABP4UD39_9MICO